MTATPDPGPDPESTDPARQRPKRGEVRVEVRVYTPHRRHVLARTLDVDQANDPRFLVELTLAELARSIAEEWQGAAHAHRDQVERRRARRGANDQPQSAQSAAYSAEAAASAAKAGQSTSDAPPEGESTGEDEDETSVSSVSSVVQDLESGGSGTADDGADEPPETEPAGEDERAPDLLDEIAGTLPTGESRR